MSDKYFSIITPCYNGAEFIENAIESVISQPCSELIELIIVDDGSTDNCADIIKKYESDTVRYFRTENMGAGHARNYGFKQATGVWTMYLDADDLFLKDSINEAFVNLIKGYDAQGLDIIYGSKLKCDMGLNTYYEVWAPETEEEICHNPRLEFWADLYRTEYLRKHKIEFFEYREQDIESAFRYRVREHSQKTVADKNVFFILQRENLTSNTHTWKEDVLHRVKALVYGQLYRENPIEKESDWLLNTALEEIINYYECCIKINSARRSDKKQINSLLSELGSDSNKNDGTKALYNRAKALKRKLLFMSDNSAAIAEKAKGEPKPENVKTERDVLLSRWAKISEDVLSGKLTGSGNLQD